MSDQPAADSTPTTPPQPTRHESLYFADGDLVLSAKSDRKAMLFRIHTSFLSRLSPVFADMVAFPQSSDNEFPAEMHDGVPSVELHDDPEDLESFLLALYKPGWVHYICLI